MSNEDIIELLLVKLEGAANMMRGMQLDPSIPNHAKEAMTEKIKDIDSIVDDYA